MNAKFCGPNLSLCCLVLSCWGIVQLLLMGIFFYVRSVALLEDLPLKEDYDSMEEFYTHADRGYDQNAQNCWIAACMYILTFFVSGYQFYLNTRQSVTI